MSGMSEAAGGRTPDGGVLLTPPAQHWACPCGATATTRVGEAHVRLHACPHVHGLMAPYVAVPSSWQPGDRLSAGVVAVEREDYERHSGLRPGVGESLTRDDRGRPMMRTTVEHDGGATHAIYVPCIEITNKGG